MRHIEKRPESFRTLSFSVLLFFRLIFLLSADGLIRDRHLQLPALQHGADIPIHRIGRGLQPQVLRNLFPASRDLTKLGQGRCVRSLLDRLLPLERIIEGHHKLISAVFKHWFRQWR